MLSACFPLKLQKRRTERRLGPTGVHARRRHFMSNYYQIITLKRRAQFHLGQTTHVLKSWSCSQKTFFFPSVGLKKKKKTTHDVLQLQITHTHAHAGLAGIRNASTHDLLGQVSRFIPLSYAVLYLWLYVHWLSSLHLIVQTYSWHSKYPVLFSPCDSELQLPELWLAKGS